MSDDWYTNGHFCRFDCLLTVFGDWYRILLVHCWYSLGRPVTIGTLMVIFAVPIVTGLPRLYQQCTNRQNSQRQSKDSQNSKNDHWCTNVLLVFLWCVCVCVCVCVNLISVTIVIARILNVCFISYHVLVNNDYQN